MGLRDQEMKGLVNPLLWCLLPQFAVLVVLVRRETGPTRKMLRALLVLSLVLAAMSTPLSRTGFEASLAVPTASDSTTAPAFIFVLGGGYRPGVTPDEDILVDESQRRVLHGVTIWRRYPDAHLVLAGATDYHGKRELDRQARLMSQAAMGQGVPASAVLLEPRSHNTREHPVQAVTLAGVTPETPIALVTSSWHMRRARREFCRYFQQVQAYPVPEVRHPVGWRDFIPTADALDDNTTLLREWAGMLWYAVRDRQKRALKC